MQNTQSDKNRSSAPDVLRGMRTVVEALRQEEFPMDNEAINYCVGSIEVENGEGGYIPVRDVTDRIPKKEYRSAEEVVRALHNVIDRVKPRAA